MEQMIFMVCMFLGVSLAWIYGAGTIMDVLNDEGSNPWSGIFLLFFMWIIIFVMAKKK